MLQTIIALSTIMWVIIDWLKGGYEHLKISKYITIGLSIFLGLAQASLFKLDLLVALGVVESATTIGTVYAGLAMSGGSAVLSKIINAFKRGE